MTDDPAAVPDADPAVIPEAVALPRRRRNLQLVWLVPALAALIGLGLGVRALLVRGPTITIQFASAEGLEPGKTKIRYKNVDIGTVRTVRLTPARDAVVVTAAMTQGAQTMLLDDTRFWVVRPRFSGGELTGVSTLLSGAYIGVDVGKSANERTDFVGLDTAPSITTSEPGREFVLRSSDLGSINVGSPVFYRRIHVGKVTAIGLDVDGRGVNLRVFVYSPYERLVTTNARFWHASGVDLSLDASGVKLQTQSLVSVLLGGIAFGAPETAPVAPAAEPKRIFTLFADEARAMKRGDAEVVPLLAYFNESMRGLAPGAPVDFRGVVVGEVKSVDVSFDTESRDFRFPVEMVLYRDVIRARVGARNANPPPAEVLLQRAIERGLRAQLRTGNLLTGQREVALDFDKSGKPPRLRTSAANGQRLEIPTQRDGLEDLQATLTNISKSIEKVPFDAIAADLRSTLQSMDALLLKFGRLPLDELGAEVRTTLGSLDASLRQFDQKLAPDLAAALADTRQTMNAANRLLHADSPTQQDLRQTLQELTRSARSLRELTELLGRQPEALLLGKPQDAPAAAGKP